MLRSILIGLEGSESGVAAEELAVQWARQVGCRLVGIAIVDTPGFQLKEERLPVEGASRASSQLLLAEPRVKVPADLRSIEQAFGRRATEAGVAFKVVEDVGTPHIQILLKAQKHDLVVLGRDSHFEYGWEGKPGETVEKVIQDSPRPVVVVPPAPVPGESIAIAYDGSLQASRALASFVETGLASGRPVHVIAAAPAGERRHAVRRAERAVAFLENHDIAATPQIVEAAREPAELILSEAQRLGAGLLIMGAYGQPVLREFFLGSVTRRVLKESPIPVFCSH